jgi:hypothetical protein
MLGVNRHAVIPWSDRVIGVAGRGGGMTTRAAGLGPAIIGYSGAPAVGDTLALTAPYSGLPGNYTFQWFRVDPVLDGGGNLIFSGDDLVYSGSVTNLNTTATHSVVSADQTCVLGLVLTLISTGLVYTLIAPAVVT